jgi:ABC-type antimicrobial peptide transport system permease subunit
MGAAVGITGAVALSSLVSTLLFGVAAIDPITYVAAAVILLVVAISAGFIPAFRASRISPMTALRTD